MQPIGAPIKPNDSGPQVEPDRGTAVPRRAWRIQDLRRPQSPDPGRTEDLAAKAKQELATQFFGEVSQGLVLDFQLLQGLTAEGNAFQQSC